MNVHVAECKFKVTWSFLAIFVLPKERVGRWGLQQFTTNGLPLHNLLCIHLVVNQHALGSKPYT